MKFHVKSSKAQMKIQQMAFMLIAVMIFFSMVALIYFAISTASLRKQAAQIKEQEAQELAFQMIGTPELAFTAGSDCPTCIDFHKAYNLANSQIDYSKLWNLDYLKIERIHPKSSSNNCDASLENCNELTIIDKAQGNLSGTKIAFVSLTRWDDESGSYIHELGRIHTLEKKTQ